MYYRDKLITGNIYHICNKSIANFGIFSSEINSFRFIRTLDYYNSLNKTKRLSHFLKANGEYFPNLLYSKDDAVVKFICYCIMPDHYHLVIRVLNDERITQYINNIENSYTRFFNEKLKRKGPLWQSYYKAVRVRTEEQFTHLTRYVHLNPTTSGLVNSPEEWKFSSYKSYITDEKVLNEIMNELSVKSMKKYRKFCEDQIDYQRKLKKIKKLLLD